MGKKNFKSLLAILLCVMMVINMAAPIVNAAGNRPDGKYEIIMDDFESYASDTELQATYTRNANGGANSTVLVESENPEMSGKALQFTYTLNSAGYSGVYRSVNGYWPGLEAVSLWFKGDGMGQDILLPLSDGASYEAHLNEVEGDWR